MVHPVMAIVVAHHSVMHAVAHAMIVVPIHLAVAHLIMVHLVMTRLIMTHGATRILMHRRLILSEYGRGRERKAGRRKRCRKSVHFGSLS